MSSSQDATSGARSGGKVARWFRSKAGITVTSAVVVVCLVAVGLIVYSNIQHGDELSAARTEYQTALTAHEKAVTTMTAKMAALTKAQAEAKNMSTQWGQALPKLRNIADSSALTSAENQAASLGKLTTQISGDPASTVKHPSPAPANATVTQYQSAQETLIADTKQVHDFTATVTQASSTYSNAQAALTASLATLGKSLTSTAAKLNQVNSYADSTAQQALTTAVASFGKTPTPQTLATILTSITNLKAANNSGALSQATSILRAKTGSSTVTVNKILASGAGWLYVQFPVPSQPGIYSQAIIQDGKILDEGSGIIGPVVDMVGDGIPINIIAGVLGQTEAQVKARFLATCSDPQNTDTVGGIGIMGLQNVVYGSQTIDPASSLTIENGVANYVIAQNKTLPASQQIFCVDFDSVSTNQTVNPYVNVVLSIASTRFLANNVTIGLHTITITTDMNFNQVVTVDGKSVPITAPAS